MIFIGGYFENNDHKTEMKTSIICLVYAIIVLGVKSDGDCPT